MRSHLKTSVPSLLTVLPPQTPLRSASHECPLAFNISKEIAQFGVNRAESAIFEKVCKTASFFAAYPEMEPPEVQSGAYRARIGM